MKYDKLLKILCDKNVSDEVKEAALDLEMAKAELRGMEQLGKQLGLIRETKGSNDGAEPSWDSASSK